MKHRSIATFRPPALSVLALATLALSACGGGSGADAGSSASAGAGAIAAADNAAALVAPAEDSVTQAASAAEAAEAQVAPAGAPGAPSVDSVSAGDQAISVAFTKPSSEGNSAILRYVTTCSDGATTKSRVGLATTATVLGLTNGASYTCKVRAVNSQGSGPFSAASSAAAPAAGLTARAQCGYSTSAYNSSESVKATATSAWVCNGSSRVLAANGLPGHAVGTFPNDDCPNTISSQSVAATYTLAPAVVSSTGSVAKVVGYALNGVKFDPGTAGTCDDTGTDCSVAGGSGTWRIEALGQTSFKFGTDTSNAHVQPSGEYHYHGMPEGFISELARAKKLTLVGWASDGFPIYSRYGYKTASDATSGTRVLKGSYQTKATPDANRPSTSLYPMGTFGQDWEYVAGSGDLDECNGRTGVTPEFPSGTYHYMITDSYPYIQRCIKGTGATDGGGGGGGGGGGDCDPTKQTCPPPPPNRTR